MSLTGLALLLGGLDTADLRAHIGPGFPLRRGEPGRGVRALGVIGGIVPPSPND